MDATNQNVEKETNMKAVYNIEERTLTLGGIVFKVNNFVRTHDDGTRSLDKPSDVIYPIVNGQYDYKRPVMPAHFPKGKWHITSTEYTEDPTFAPVKIKTDAHQMLKVWTLEKDGTYGKETEEMVDDSGYYFHASWSRTSLGCGILETKKAALKLAKLCEACLQKGEAVDLEVI